MVRKKSKLFLLLVFLVFSILICLNFVSAWIDCYQYGAQNGGTPDSCVAAGCVVTSDNVAGVETIYGYNSDNVSFDCMCSSDYSSYCCLEKMCWQWDATSQNICETNDGTLNCTWNGFPATNYYQNGTSFEMNGTCYGDWNAMGDDNFGGAASGCWQYDGDRGQCASSANTATCEWKANDQNQNPWCWIKTLGDALIENSFATINDIGCCEQKGCWTYDGNESQCMSEGVFAGLCTYVNKTDDLWCPDPAGCCYSKMCNEAGDNHTLCNMLKTQMMMPCTNESGTCQDMGGGGFMFFDDTDSCMGTGGWWNGTACEMPTITDGGGAFMFGGEAHCWFADNQPLVCGNITGCAYCATGTGNYGVDNSSDNNICYNKQIGYCEGHDSWDSQIYTNANNTANLVCSDIQIKSACNYGPLPNCVWNSSVNVTGSYCAAGTSSEKKAVPPVMFCEHPDAKNNYTLCKSLWEEYMMPCKWDNSSTIIKNCTFNSNAVFGSGSGTGSNEQEYEIINSEYSCIAAGGTWMKEYYLDNGILKQDQWCEKGALFDLSTGTAAANKGSCDSDCWACEFNSSGGAWENNGTLAEAACVGSALGYCRWTTDTNSPNKLGWCDYPEEMSYGAGDCQINCNDCGMMLDAYSSCLSSSASCKWVNDTNMTGSVLATGSCVSKNKKVCDTDCFSCYDSQSCFASSTDCMWDATNILCKPNNFDGEICFDGTDNDKDGMIDCADPDCSFDMACGGSSFGDCAMYDDDQTACEAAIAFGNTNCTWINNTWEPNGHCGMPGEICWQWDGNLTGCGAQPGCTNESSVDFGSGFCDVNISKIDSASCWNIGSEESCTGNCSWVNWTNPGGSISGFCDYYLFADCISMDGNVSGCQANGNCTWFASEQICEPVCFSEDVNESACTSDNRSGICEWRNTTDMCMPEFFDIMGGGGGGVTGCMQYDGNMTACLLNNYTCTWFNDTSVDNNLSADEPDGWCDPKGNYDLVGEMQGEPVMLGMDSDNNLGGAEAGISGYVDIMGFGMRVTDNAYGFGTGVYNITDAAICNGYPISIPGQETISSGIGINATRFRWYLDTDGDSSSLSHCNATDSNEVSLGYPNYEFYIDYLVRNNTDTGSIETTKKLYVCIQNSNNEWQWAPTNVFITDDKKFTCFTSNMGSPFVSIEKETLENFNLFDITEPMRVFAVSFNGTGEGDGADEVGPAYYTPGTIDFDFVDCSNPMIKDPKCKSFQKFGAQMFEDCKNGVDDDSDGYADCADPKCIFSPACVGSGTAFNFIIDTNDNKAPVVMFSKVEKMADSAIIIYDTDEPANGSLMFYNTSSTCALNVTPNIDDLGDIGFSFDDYKPFHRANLNNDTLGFDLINNTAYYYKVKVCDPSGNCGISKCLNFTTRKQNKNFIFRIDLPDGYVVNITAGDGSTLYAGNFTYYDNSSTNTYDIGIKTNTSQTKNMNITVSYEDMHFKFVGADLYKPKTLSLDGAFIADTDNEILGMNSSTKAWNFLLSDLGMGGSGDSVELSFPVAYSASNTLTWAADDGSNSSDVKSYSSCSGDSSQTNCKIPTSLGFSSYTISVPATTPPADSSSGGGSSGGGSSIPTFTISDEQFEEGYTKAIPVNSRFRLKVENKTHHVQLIELTNTTAKINISSTPQIATLSIGDTRRFEVSEDNYYDLSVTLDSINSTSNKAEFTIKSLYEEVTPETILEEEEKEKIAKGEEMQEKSNLIWLWIILGIFVLAGIIFLGIFVRRRK